MSWNSRFEAIGAFWLHDMNFKRPFALLTSGKISNFFFNGSKVIERPKLLEEIAQELKTKILAAEPRFSSPGAVVGPSLGAVTLAYELARAFGTLAWFTESETGKNQTLKRFSPETGVNTILAAEDVITTGESLQSIVDAMRSGTSPLFVHEIVACIINRSNRKFLPNGMEIVSLLEVPALTWDRGHNPFTPDGQEVIEPVRPKKNWEALTREYESA